MQHHPFWRTDLLKTIRYSIVSVPGGSCKLKTKSEMSHTRYPPGGGGESLRAESPPGDTPGQRREKPTAGPASGESDERVRRSKKAVLTATNQLLSEAGL